MLVFIGGVCVWGIKSLAFDQVGVPTFLWIPSSGHSGRPREQIFGRQSSRTGSARLGFERGSDERHGT